MLESISLKFTELADPLRIPAQGVTVFVGPNNSGKSLVLREIEQEISSHARIQLKILNDIEIVWMTEDDLNINIENLTKKAPPGIPVEHVYIGRFNPSGNLDANNVNLQHLRNYVINRNDRRWVTSQFLRFFLLRLDGRTRFALTDDRPRGDLLGSAQNTLMHLFQNDADRKKVRDIIFDAFGVYFTIEQLSADSLRIRLSAAKPDESEQHWSDTARQFHSAALHIKEASDGVQAFVGIVSAVLSGDYRAVLVDEPEAFLHPPLARKLGYQLTNNLKAGGTLMAATHSPDFLMGCLQASAQIRVVRLEYSEGKSRGRIVDPSVITRLFKSPLLRSANIISSLFHDGVVVTESDNDRAFYAEIYFRLAEQEKGYPSLLFVNAQNKQTIRDIVGPLREFGVPAAAIADIDILKDGGGDWKSWLKAAHVPLASHVGLGQQRATLHQLFVSSGLDMENGGIELLSDDDQVAANDLLDQIQQYGIFVVRRGELESWLAHLGVKSKKSTWTVEILERMGSEPSDGGYVRPSAGDVWDFMRNIVCWIRNSRRKGTL